MTKNSDFPVASVRHGFATRRDRALPGRQLALDRMNVDGAQTAHPQHFQLELAIDVVAIERADQIIDTVDVDAVELDDDPGRQAGLSHRPSASICANSAPILLSMPAATAGSTRSGRTRRYRHAAHSHGE
jgi:hypothetical protein